MATRAASASRVLAVGSNNHVPNQWLSSAPDLAALPERLAVPVGRYEHPINCSQAVDQIEPATSAPLRRVVTPIPHNAMANDLAGRDT